MTLIYKICPDSLWRAAEQEGVFKGAPVDLADGYIHFSTGEQAVETAAKHFKGEPDLVLVSVDDATLGPALRYEPSRGGALFPHLYGPLHIAAVHAVLPLPLGPDGTHLFPDLSRNVAADGEPIDPAKAGWVLDTDNSGSMTLVGPFWTKPNSGGRLHGFLAEARHLNRNGVVHGGMIMTFADSALALASMALTGGRKQATIQLDTQFLDGVKAGDFVVAECRALRQGGSLMFMSAHLSVGDRAVAAATGVWKLLKP
jgi:uncharacterized protein (TIGR00369 family)